MSVGILCPFCGDKVVERTIDVAKMSDEELAPMMIMAGLDDSEAYWSHLNTHGFYFEGGVAG